MEFSEKLPLSSRYAFPPFLRLLQTGIIGDRRDLERREKYFGKNLKPLPQVPPLFESIKEALNDRILLSLAIAAFFTIITNMVATGPAWGWV